MRSFKKIFKNKLLALISISNIFVVNISCAKVASIVTNEYYIPYKNQKIHLKEKIASSKKTSKSTKVIVLINPLSIPSLVAFDIPGYSLMDSLTAKDYDVWGIDFIGQGKSSYPLVMKNHNAPIGNYPLQANEAVEELHQVINYIVKKTGKHNISILGWSWGSVVGAMYAIDHPNQVEHLILYGSMYSSHLQESIQPMFIKPFMGKDNNFSEDLPAYQNIPWKIINAHWNMMINGNKNIVEEKAMNAVGNAYKTIDPNPFIPESLRRPMGPMKDLYSIWNGKPIYDISKLTVPTLVIYGDQDLFADHKLFSKLTNVKIKQEVELKEATHWLIYEKTRNQFLDDVVKFLDGRAL